MSPTLTVRVTTPIDETAVAQLLAASYTKLMPSGYDAEILTAVLPVIVKANLQLLASGTFYLIEATTPDGVGHRQVVGCGGWTPERPGTTDVETGLGHIRHFATHPDWLGQGIGRSIYNTCERDARLAGVRGFECYSSLNAEGFYSAMGFETIRRVEIPLGNGNRLPSILMRYRFPLAS